MIRRCLIVAALATFAMTASAEAQGTFGNRSLGGGISPGQRTLTGGGATAGGENLAGSDTGTLSGNERFLRDNRQAGQFVGSDSADASAAFGTQSQFAGSGAGGAGGTTFSPQSAYGRSGLGSTAGGLGGQRSAFGSQALGGRSLGTQGFGGAGFGSQGFGAQSFGGGFGQQALGRTGAFGGRGQSANLLTRGGRTYRTELIVGFEFEAPAVSAVRTEAVSRLRNLDKVRGLGTVNVDVVDRVVVLAGQVPDERSRRLAEQLLMLEPGIDRVDNQLVISGQ